MGKSPVPGFSFGVYQQCWDVMRSDLTKVFRSFMEVG